MYIRFNTEITSVTGGNKGSVRIFRFNTAETAMSDHACVQ